MHLHTGTEEVGGMNSKDVLATIDTVRKRTRRRVAIGLAEPEYAADSKTVLKLLKDAVAAEVVNVVGPSHPELVAAESLLRMVADDLAGDRSAIERYGDIREYFGRQNSTTGRMLQAILAAREQHAGELGNLLEDMRSRLRNKLRSKLN